MIHEQLIALWMTVREAKLYLAGLETWTAPASVIWRVAEEKRVTAYQTLTHMVKRWWCSEMLKNHKMHYTMLDPQLLVAHFEEQAKGLKQKLPEMLWLMNQVWTKPKVVYYEWREQLKDLFLRIIASGKEMKKGEYFLSFFGVTNMDPWFEKWLSEEFIEYRLTCSTKTKSLTTNESHAYIEYTKTNHETRIVQDPVFDMANEIVMYGKNKVALVMYNTDELSAVVIESESFYRGLKSIFYTLWNTLDK